VAHWTVELTTSYGRPRLTSDVGPEILAKNALEAAAGLISLSSESESGSARPWGSPRAHLDVRTDGTRRSRGSGGALSSALVIAAAAAYVLQTLVEQPRLHRVAGVVGAGVV
jgi:hypothetical protein